MLEYDFDINDDKVTANPVNEALNNIDLDSSDSESEVIGWTTTIPVCR